MGLYFFSSYISGIIVLIVAGYVDEYIAGIAESDNSKIYNSKKHNHINPVAKLKCTQQILGSC